MPQNSDLCAAGGEALWPESMQAVEYVRTRAAKLSAAGLRERIRAAAQELDNLVAEVTEAEARARPFPDKWTIAEVVDHVAQTQIRAAEEMRHLLEGRRPPGPPVYDALRSGAAAWAPWTELTDGLRSANRELVALLETVSDESALPTGATARAILVIHRADPNGPSATQIFSVELSWKEYALVQRLHLIDHRNQIKKLRESRGCIVTGMRQWLSPPTYLEALERFAGPIYWNQSLAASAVTSGQINPRQFGVTRIFLNLRWSQLRRRGCSTLSIETIPAMGDQMTSFVPCPTNVHVRDVVNRALKPSRIFQGRDVPRLRRNAGWTREWLPEIEADAGFVFSYTGRASRISITTAIESNARLNKVVSTGRGSASPLHGIDRELAMRWWRRLEHSPSQPWPSSFQQAWARLCG